MNNNDPKFLIYKPGGKSTEIEAPMGILVEMGGKRFRIQAQNGQITITGTGEEERLLLYPKMSNQIVIE